VSGWRGRFLAGALPGLAVVLWFRADAPVNRPEVARVIERDLGQLQAAVPWPMTPVNVVREDDDVLFPLGRYALADPSERAARRDAAGVVGSQLGAGCRTEANQVVCGATK